MSSGLSTLAVKNDVFPFDGADMLQETDVDVFAFWNGARRDVHEPIEIVEAFTRRPTTKRARQRSSPNQARRAIYQWRQWLFSLRPTALMCVESGNKSTTREMILSERFSSNSSFTPAPRRASARGRPQRRSKH